MDWLWSTRQMRCSWSRSDLAQLVKVIVEQLQAGNRDELL